MWTEGGGLLFGMSRLLEIISYVFTVLCGNDITTRLLLIKAPLNMPEVLISLSYRPWPLFKGNVVFTLCEVCAYYISPLFFAGL